MLNAALQYAERGWPVIPLHSIRDGKCTCGRDTCNVAKHPRTQNGLKDATTDQIQIKRWWEQYPDANIGVITGRISGIFVLDVDVKNNGEKSLSEVVAEMGPIPETLRAKTGGGGYHYVFRYPDAVRVANRTNLKPGLDIRGDGGYIVAPPSLHKLGSYKWENDVVPLEPGERLLDFVTRRAVHGAQTSYGTGQRNQGLAALAGALRRQGIAAENILEILLRENVKRCDPPLPDVEVKKIADSISRYDPAVDTSHFTDMGNRDRLISKYGDDIRYCPEMGKWLLWRAGIWQLDVESAIHSYAQDTIRTLFNTAANDATRKWAVTSESRKRLSDMVKLAESSAGVTVHVDQLDSDHNLLSVANGVLDLQSGRLLEPDKGMLITKRVGTYYDEDAKCFRWLDFLDRVMDGDKELISFLQRVIGYSLTGDVSEHAMFIFYGTGANGKSTFISTVQAMLGDYSQQSDATSFLAKPFDGVRNDIARMVNRRLVCAVEIPEGRQLAESLIKQITGGDRVAARYLFQEYFEFIPQFKLILACNQKPIVKGVDEGIWRRIHLVPWTVHIPAAERDPDLVEKLKGELPGILRWAVEGCLDWRFNGLRAPDKVKKATNAYRSEQDILAMFLEECCEIPPNGSTTRSRDLYMAYTNWCSASGERPATQAKFGQTLRERGLESKKMHGGVMTWRIKLLNMGSDDGPNEF